MVEGARTQVGARTGVGARTHGRATPPGQSMAAAEVLELPTPHGPARAHLDGVESARAAVVLGHGAGGGVAARDLLAARQAALSRGIAVALIEQPYRVAGRRSPPSATQLDADWIAVIDALRNRGMLDLELIVGGRSSGARVACRTAGAAAACAVLCLAFPLQPARRRHDGTHAPSRLDELDAVSVPVLVVQGESDPFGIPPAGINRRVVALRGDHSLRSDVVGIEHAIAGWLDTLALPAS